MGVERGPNAEYVYGLQVVIFCVSCTQVRHSKNRHVHEKGRERVAAEKCTHGKRFHKVVTGDTHYLT